MSATFTEVLPATKSCPHSAIRFTPGEFEGTGTVVIDRRRGSAEYVVTEIPCGGAFDGRAFRFVKGAGSPGTDPNEDGYAVFVGRNRQDRLCECKGFGRWGGCKHTATALALIENGWL